MKPIMWCGDSLQRLRGFPDDARHESGHQLNRVQCGREPRDWKPMTSIGSGVQEMRIHQDGEFRVLYVAKFVEAVYVLHAFQKKTRKTPPRELDLAGSRYRAVVAERKG